MQYHTNAALTVTQRTLVHDLAAQGVSHAELARRFGVHRRTIQRWVARAEPTDRSSAPRQHGRLVVTDDYRAAVLAERTTQPHHGPQRIADDLRERFPTANRTTVWRILHAAGLSRRAPKQTAASPDSGGEQVEYPPSIPGQRYRLFLTANPDRTTYRLQHAWDSRLLIDGPIVTFSDGLRTPVTFDGQVRPATFLAHLKITIATQAGQP